MYYDECALGNLMNTLLLPFYINNKQESDDLTN